jgi:hypothetical protein
MAAVSRFLTACALLLALLALPATALAQSAGDDQYSDPLAEQPTTQDQQQQPDSDQGSTAPPTSTPAPTQSAPAQTGTESGVESADGQLPVTGLDVVLLCAAAAALLLGGFALRRVARDV